MSNFKYHKIIKKLRRKGVYFLREAKGSHQIWFNPENERRIVIPKHTGNLPTGTLLSIIKNAGFKNLDEFRRF